MVEYLRLQAPNAWGLVLILDQETRSHMLELKILHAMRKTQHSQETDGQMGGLRLLTVFGFFDLKVITQCVRFVIIY